MQVNGDALDEVNETYFVNLTNASNATITDGSGVGTITDDDPVPTLSIGDRTVTEGDSGTVDATFTVTLSTVSGRTVTVDYATANGTATSPADYTAVALATLTFNPGQTSRTVTVSVNGDVIDEPDETFNVNLSGAVGRRSSTARCRHDHRRRPAAYAQHQRRHGHRGQHRAPRPQRFTVSLSSPSGRTVSVQYATANGTAIAPADYAAAPARSRLRRASRRGRSRSRSRQRRSTRSARRISSTSRVRRTRRSWTHRASARSSTTTVNRSSS